MPKICFFDDLRRSQEEHNLFEILTDELCLKNNLKGSQICATKEQFLLKQEF